MQRNERYEVNSQGTLVTGVPVTLTPSERKQMIEKMFSINGWSYTLLEEITPAHYEIELKNSNLQQEKRLHLYHGNVRKEDPERSREEKKIQLGTENDPRIHFENALILGFYVFEQKDSLTDAVIVAWPVERRKNYPANPSLRVNMKTAIMPAKNRGYYVDRETGKNLVAFRPEFIYHYLEYGWELPHSVSEQERCEEDHKEDSLERMRIPGGTNRLLYGVPGSGKSFMIQQEYCKTDTHVERIVFYPDYTYSDFIGQILPIVSEDGQISYQFVPGPFTTILSEAYHHPQEEYLLIIEEMNRGNAPAIFGEVFQLLDRKLEMSELDDGYPIGTSEYGITHVNIAKIVYQDSTHKVRIPSNLSIIGTMNTSDQNVFTLDTAFQRRWEMRLVENRFKNSDKILADAVILDTGVTWKTFCTQMNRLIVENGTGMTSAEDKRLGVHFVHIKDLEYATAMDSFFTGEYNTLCEREQTGAISDLEKDRLVQIRTAVRQNRRFPEKVVKYLWDDAFRFHRELVFETSEYQSLEQVIHHFLYAEKTERFHIFQQTVKNLLLHPTE